MAGRVDVSFRGVSVADVLWTLEKRQRDWEREVWMRRWGHTESKDMSYSDIPTVPFGLMNFHFRGQSVSMTATLVLWPKTDYCRL